MIKIVHLVDRDAKVKGTQGSTGHRTNSQLIDKNLNFCDTIEIETRQNPLDLLDKLEEINPDIVFTNTLNNCIVDSIPSIQRKYFTVLKVAFNFIELQMYETFLGFYPKMIDSFKHFDVLIPSSETQKSNLEALGHQYVSEVIYPMVDIDYFKQFRNMEKQNMICTTGRHVSIKNMFLNIMATENLMKRHPKCVMNIFNSGKDTKYIINYIKQSSFKDRIGVGGEKNINEIYNISKIMLSLSLTENHSVSVIEARASGIPVVGSRISGHYGVIPTPYDDIQSASDIMYYLLTDEKYFKKCVKNGYNGLDDYKPEIVKEKYNSLFEKIMEWNL